MLPAAYPNLLVNGASGIAVGMATNMAPHNLIEVVAAAIHLLENPDATVEDLMEFVPGPDFPSGGIVMGLDGVKDAYTKGRGAFKVRGKVVGRAARPAPHRARRHGAAVPGRPRADDREDQGCRAGQAPARHRRRHRPDRPQPRAAARDRHQDRLRPAGGARPALPADAARGLVQHQQRRARRRVSRRPSASRSCCGSTSTTASRSSRAAAATAWRAARSACTSSRVCSSRSSTSTRSSR